ncbi:hypothetical protein ACFXP7_10955 [Microbacterium sp. P06]|uniref:hypothetical protein n=1 Tax=Microbacterium sp. P06 TaxID=3366949 RepID=UPI00374706D9
MTHRQQSEEPGGADEIGAARDARDDGESPTHLDEDELQRIAAHRRDPGAGGHD